MTAPRPDPRLRDPLTEVARKERLYLCGVSTAGFTSEYTGLIPSEITTLGIKFGEANQNALLYIPALVIAYFLCAFAIYAASDFLAWRTSLYEWNTDWYDKFRQKDKEERANLEAEWTKVRDQVIGEDVHNTDVQKQVMELEENASVRERREYPEPWWLLNLRRRESAWLAWLKRQGRTTEATRLISAWDALYERFEQEKIYETEIRGRSRFRYLILSLMVPVSILRAIFEFLLPIGVGLSTILVLVF